MTAWYLESRRHSLASRGIKSAQKLQNMRQIKSGQAKFFTSLWDKNKGKFFRGQLKGGEGLGFGVLGRGVYLTWDKRMADAFGQIMKTEKGGTVETITVKIPRDLKLLDKDSKIFRDAKEELGVGRFEDVGSPLFGHALTRIIQSKGYDGVISDSVADGLVIFDESKIIVT